MLASTTLALLTLVWSAPVALAQNDETDPSPPTTTTTRQQQQEPTTRANTLRQQEQETETPTPTRTRPAPPTTTTRETPTPHPTTPRETPQPSPKPIERPTTTTAPPTTTTTTTPTTTSSAAAEIAVPEPKATLSVSPKQVRQGETVTADARCENGRVRSLTASGVNFSGNTGRVDQNAPIGGRTVTLICENGSKTATASDSFTVVFRNGGPDQDVRASLSVWPKVVRPGDTLSANPRCENGRIESLRGDDVNFSGNRGRVNDRAGEGNRTVTLTCVSERGNKRVTATDNFRIARDGGWGNGDPRATLSVSPHTVRPGDYIWANGGCYDGYQESLRGDDVSFRGDRGWVDDNAREGEHTVRRVCRNGGKTVEATDTFRVDRDGHGPWDGRGPDDFWLSDRSGYQGDDVDASVRCRDDRARLESNALEDITLHREGGRLRGTTHVDNNADEGWHRVTVYCDGNSESRWFLVKDDDNSHGSQWLDFDPGYGHRGDEVDVHVRCEHGVGRLDGNGILDNIELDRDSENRWSGTTTVQDDADFGEHTIKIRCGDDTLSQDFFVRGEGDKDDNDHSPSGGEYVSVYPKGGIETGGGPVGAPIGLGALTLTGAGITTNGGRTRRSER